MPSNEARDAYDALDRTITVLLASGVEHHRIISALVAQINNRLLRVDTPEGDIRTCVIGLLKR